MITGAPDPTDVGPTWRLLFPLLERAFAAVADRQPMAASDREITTITRVLADAAVREYCDIPLEALMPTLAWAEELPWDSLGSPQRNGLLRKGIKDPSDLLSWTPRDVLDLPGIGNLTAMIMLETLARTALQGGTRHGAISALPPDEVAAQQGATLSAANRPDSHDIAQRFGEDTDVGHESASFSRLEEDVATLARWHVMRGDIEAPVLGGQGLTEAPEHVRAAWNRLMAVAPADLVDVSTARPALLLEGYLNTLAAREVMILRQRTFADDPATLDALGQQLDLTRERVRQIARQVEANLTEEVMRGDLGDLAAAVRSRIGLACRLEHLLDVFPALNESVPSLNQPAWRVLDRLDSTFEIEDGWAAVPGVSQARETTRSVVAASVNALGLAELDDVAQRLAILGADRRAELRAWLESSGCVVFEDHVSPRQLSIPDWAALILNGAGAPLPVDEIAERMPVDRAVSSIRNALAVDERFVRADKDTFALAEWGGPAYAGIRDAIGRAIDAGGGAVDLEVLVRDLTTQFTVAESSVRAYAQAHPFVTQQGKVRRRESTAVPTANPSATRRLYRRDDGWAWRLQITADHARGSGSVIPTAFARVIGMSPGDSLSVRSSDGTQSVYWTGLQPSLGSIRRHVELSGLKVGDWACAVVDDDGGFSLVPVHTDSRTGAALALALAGIPQTDVADVRETLAQALSLPPTSSWSSIIAAARNRGDDDLAEALIADPAVDAGAAERSAQTTVPATDSTVDEILDLL